MEPGPGRAWLNLMAYPLAVARHRPPFSATMPPMDASPDPWDLIEQVLAIKAAGHALSSQQEDVLRAACDRALVQTLVLNGLSPVEAVEALGSRVRSYEVAYDGSDQTLNLHVEWKDR